MAIEVLFFSNDLGLAKSINSASKLTLDQLSVHPCGTIEKFIDLAKRIQFKFILVDEPHHSQELENILSALKKRETGSNLPIAILISSSIENVELQKKLRSGYTDVVLKPVDLSLLLHKVDLYSPDKKVLKENLLFQMNVDGDVEIQLTGKFVQASEFGATVRADRLYGAGDIVSFYPTMLNDTGTYEGGTCLARVIASHPAQQAGLFDTVVTFLGPNPKFMTALRLWMRRQFISSSEKRESQK